WNPMPGGITYAWQVFSSAGSGFVQHPNGDGQMPVPGDLIIWNANVGWGAGHIAVVDYVSDNTVHYVQQNTPSPTGSVNIRNGRLDDPNVTGFLHDKSNSNTAGGGYEIAFQANNGQLFTSSSSSGSTNTQQGMMSGTSPSIAP